jgi:hypothetical protein
MKKDDIKLENYKDYLIDEYPFVSDDRRTYLIENNGIAYYAILP